MTIPKNEIFFSWFRLFLFSLLFICRTLKKSLVYEQKSLYIKVKGNETLLVSDQQGHGDDDDKRKRPLKGQAIESVR